MVEVFLKEEGTHGVYVYHVLCTSKGKEGFYGEHHPNGIRCYFSRFSINRVLYGDAAAAAYKKHLTKIRKEALNEY